MSAIAQCDQCDKKIPLRDGDYYEWLAPVGWRTWTYGRERLLACSDKCLGELIRDRERIEDVQ